MHPKHHTQYWLDEVDEHSWIISDTHFNHQRIMEYEPCRVSDMQAKGYSSMDEWLIDNWNAHIAQSDLVVHLGDFSFKGVSRYLDRLNGRIILLLGNHDIPSLKPLMRYAQRRPDKLRILQGCEGLSEPEEVSGFIKTIRGKKVMFSHYPLISLDRYGRGKAQITRNAMAQVFKAQGCEINVHGHVHSNDAHTDPNEINVSLERTGFGPKTIGSVLEGVLGEQPDV